MKIDLGCGPSKRPGYIGLDIEPHPCVDRVLNFEKDQLPFEDDSVEEVFSSHCWEHIEHPINILRELARVCKDGARLELWMPYGHSDDGVILGHRVFYTELHWRHFCIDYDDVWQGTSKARLRLRKIRYSMNPEAVAVAEKLGLTNAQAIRHLNNAAWEFGIFLDADKVGRPKPDLIREYGYGREGC